MPPGFIRILLYKLKQLSAVALAQIEDRRYDTEMTAKGVKTIFKYGVAFSGKQVEITTGSLGTEK